MFRWLKSRQEEGLSISSAVERWNELAGEGRDPLDEYSRNGKAFERNGEVPQGQVEQLRQRWLDACMAYDETTADQVLNQAFSLFPVEMVCIEFFQRGMRAMGEGWYRGEISVQQEHFTSELAMRRVGALIAITPPPTRLGAVLAVCPPGEWHAFPLQLLTLLLRRRGLRVINLGANVPQERLIESIHEIHPSLVVIAAQGLVTAAALRQVSLKLLTSEVPAAYGGWIFNRTPGLRSRIPAHFLGESIDIAAQNVQMLNENPAPLPAGPPLSPSQETANQAFRSQRVRIEAEIFRASLAQGWGFDRVQVANTFFNDALSAALELGDHEALAADYAWIRVRLEKLGFPPDWPSIYLATYRQAVQKVLGDEAGVILAAFDALD
jgi:methanogenic corrinoid protein MtbC1